jgi:hypothetical protein
VALILLEIGARFLPPPYENFGETADICSNQLGWRGRPFFETTVETDDYVHDLMLNSVGMHDEEHPQSKPDDAFRILILGDSFIRAHQVREAGTSHQILEDLLNKKNSPQRFEVISAGVDAWGTGQELLYYRSEGRLYQPDLVILMFYLGNDVDDNLPGRGRTLNGRNCYAPFFALCGDELDASPWLYAPGVRSATGECLSGRKLLSHVLGKIYQTSRLYAQIEPLFASARLPEASALEYYAQEDELFDYGLQLAVELVKRLDQEVERDGAEFMTVIVSPASLVDFTRMDSNEREAVYQSLPFMRQAEQIDPPNQYLTEALSDEGIRTLDLLPSFVAYIDETGEPLHFEYDKHWNAAGNRLAAETMYSWLSEYFESQ